MQNGAQKNALFDGLDIAESREALALLNQERPQAIIKEARRNGANGVKPVKGNPSSTLEDAIDAIRDRHNGKRVVLLVDEYDYGLTRVLEVNGGQTDIRLQENQEALTELYSRCKALSDENQFYYSCYAGVSMFGATSFFSGFNHVDDMTFDSEIGSVLGFTRQEVTAWLAGHMAYQGIGINELDSMAGGYQFSKSAETVLNLRTVVDRLRSKTNSVRAMRPRWANKLLIDSKIPILSS
eukprot:3568397-Amphidinium_carterae.1